MIPHALLPQFAGLAVGMLATMLAQPPINPGIDPADQPKVCFRGYRGCLIECLVLLPDGPLPELPAPQVPEPDFRNERGICFTGCQDALLNCLENMDPGSFEAVGKPCHKQFLEDLATCKWEFRRNLDFSPTTPPNPARRQAMLACFATARAKLVRCLAVLPNPPKDFSWSITPPPDHVAIDLQAMDVQFTVEGIDELTRMQWWAIPDAPEVAPGEGGQAPPPPEPVMLIELFVLSVGPLPLSVPLTALPAGSPAFILAAVLVDDTGEVIVDPAGQPLLFTHEVTRGAPPAP